jgi:deferrochelatase/peroxidase EfeB
MAIIDIEAQERKAGSIARAALRASLLNQIRQTFRKRSGALEKSTVNARYKVGRLDRLVINTPKYSFTQHYGSTKTGTQKETSRKATSVKSFSRFFNGQNQEVQSHTRAATTVKAFNKNEPYNAKNHIARALNQTNALQVLATSLGENRITNITSQIDF